MVKVLNLKLLLRLERASRYFSAVPIELYTNDVHAHPHVQEERTRELNEGVSLSRGWQRQVGRGSGFQLRIALSLYGSISLTLARHVRTSDPALSR